MEQAKENSYIQEYETFSEFSREQGSAFRTSIFGFDKEDVISYIDRLVKDVTDQKNSLEEAHIRLTEQNRDLVERINRYEQQIFVVRQELDDEKKYNDNAREREELFRKAVGVLQEKVAYLQDNTSSKELEESFKTQMQKANDIVVRLRKELLGKDESLGKMNNEISRRNEILLNQDKLLLMKDKHIEEFTVELENAKQKINEQTSINERLNEQISSMKNQISDLENRLRDISRENSKYSNYRDNQINVTDYGYQNNQQNRQNELNESSRYRQPQNNDMYGKQYSDDYRYMEPEFQYTNNNYPNYNSSYNDIPRYSDSNPDNRYYNEPKSKTLDDYIAELSKQNPIY